MSTDNEALKRLFDEQLAAKRRRREALAARPIEDKLRILVRLQEVASAIGQATRGHARRPWQLR